MISWNTLVDGQRPMFLSPLRMSQQELDAFPDFAPAMDRYLAIRNKILLLWDSSSKQAAVTLEQVFRGIRPTERERARKIFEFLDINLYININVEKPHFNPRKRPADAGKLAYTVPATPLWKSRRIVVVGAGVSGLIAARTLVDAGFANVIVLEAKTRVGGRVCTGYTSSGCPIELGASFIHGTQGNPITSLARKIGATLYAPSPACDLYDYDGHPVPPDLDERLESEWNRLLDRTVDVRKGSVKSVSTVGGPAQKGWSLADGLQLLMKHEVVGSSVNWKLDNELSKLVTQGFVSSNDIKSPLGRSLAREERILNWHFANIEGPCAAPLERLDLYEWDQDDAYEYAGEHCLITSGYGDLPRALAMNLDVRLDHQVTEIDDTSSAGIIIRATSRTGQVELVADHAIVAVPLGVLKKRSIAFSPPLPPTKVAAIDRIGFGLFNKVFLVFPQVFWNTNDDYIGVTSLVRGKFYMFLGLHKACQQPVLMGYVAGTVAHALEAFSDAEIVDDAMQALQKIFSRDGRQVPWPTEAAVTRWAADPFAGGSYSFVESEAAAADYDVMAEPVSGRLFFAGEHTCRRHPATVAGACRSGHREAIRIIQACEESYMGPSDDVRSGTKRRKTDESWIAVGATDSAFDAIPVSDDELDDLRQKKSGRVRTVASKSKIGSAKVESEDDLSYSVSSDDDRSNTSTQITHSPETHLPTVSIKLKAVGATLTL
jgi:[histone H3]-N6,N6-dimethyl-L-lysine4 FAD-dependent demethylase